MRMTHHSVIVGLTLFLSQISHGQGFQPTSTMSPATSTFSTAGRKRILSMAPAFLDATPRAIEKTVFQARMPSTATRRQRDTRLSSHVAAPSAVETAAEHGYPHASSLLNTVFSWPPLAAVAESPMFWSTVVMLSIVALLYSWEEVVEMARERLPSTLQPVVDSMLAEMGALGFVGLVLGVVVVEGPIGDLVGELSDYFLGSEEILLESFEFLHTAFFEVGIGFFVIAGLTVLKVVKKIESLELVSRAVFDLDGDGEVTLSEIAEVLDVETVVVDLDGDGNISDDEIKLALRTIHRPSLWEQLTQTDDLVKAEALVIRERVLGTCNLKDSFQVEDYFTGIFGKNLKEIVDLSPLTWLPLIPVLSLGRSIDLARDIVSASSPNAYLNCGMFIESPMYLVTSTLSCFVSVMWGVWNFWKMVQIKDMLIPTLVRDSASGGDAVLLPPRFEDPGLRAEFNSSPIIPIAWLESLWYKRPRNNHEALFGAVGAAGPDFYRTSIKLQTWLAVCQIVFWGTQIVGRDLYSLAEGLTSASPSIYKELGLYGFYVALALGQLWLVPKTFLDFCLATSVEQLLEEDVFSDSCGSLDETEKQKFQIVNGQIQLKSTVPVGADSD